MDRRSMPYPFSRVVRVLMGLLGAGSFGTGVLAVFVTQNGTGTGVLLAFGGVLLVLALLGNRIESLEFGGATLRLQAAAAERFAAAEESERRGDPAAAGRLRAEAEALLEAAGPLVAEYRAVRGSMRPGPVRTDAMSAITSEARRLSEERPFEPAEVRRWLRSGSDGQRIIALAMMQANRELRDFDAVIAAIEVSRSAFEQYNAMSLATQLIDDLDQRQLRRLAHVIEFQRDGSRFRRDTDRWRLSEQLLQRVNERSGAAE